MAEDRFCRLARPLEGAAIERGEGNAFQGDRDPLGLGFAKVREDGVVAAPLDDAAGVVAALSVADEDDARSQGSVLLQRGER